MIRNSMIVESVQALSDTLISVSYWVISWQVVNSFYQMNVFKDFSSAAENGKKKRLKQIIYFGGLYGLFILLCGFTHLLHAVRDMWPSSSVNYAATVLLVLCTVVSSATAIAGFTVFPVMIRMWGNFNLTDEGHFQHMETYIVDILDMFKESIVVINTEGEISRGNKATMDLFGTNFMNISVFDCIHPEDIQVFTEFARAARCEGATVNDRLAYRLRATNSSYYKWVESHICIKASINSSDHLELNMITRDIDDRKMAELAAQRMEASKVESALNDAKLKYISCTAHDLKTPLHTFCVAMGLLQETNLSTEQRDILESAIVSTDLMKLTISQTMDITKVITGSKLTPRYSSVDLGIIIKRISIVIEGYSKQVPINYSIASEVRRRVFTDEEWVWQMLLNLLTNACKFTDSGSIDLCVGLDATIDKNQKTHLLFEVRDTGIGLTEEQNQRAFLAFSQLQMGTSTGTGLGLYGLKLRAEAMGGVCGVHTNTSSSTGTGTVFWFALPYKPDTMAEQLTSDDVLFDATANMAAIDIKELSCPSRISADDPVYKRSNEVWRNETMVNASDENSIKDLNTSLGVNTPASEAATPESGGDPRQPPSTPSFSPHHSNASSRSPMSATFTSPGSSRGIAYTGPVSTISSSIAEDALLECKMELSVITTSTTGQVGTRSTTTTTTSSPTPNSTTAPSATATRSHPIAFVVDDMVTIRKLMTKVLEKYGFQNIQCFENGAQALIAMKKMEPAIVFSDIQMPVMTGLEMIERFRSFEATETANGSRTSRQIVVAVTANGQEVEDKLVGINGFDNVMLKPFNMTELKLVLKTYLPEHFADLQV